MLAKYDFSKVGSLDTPLTRTFNSFSAQFTIDSKEAGVTRFRPYRSQIILLEEIATGIKQNIHNFVVLKGRQLGISTFGLGLDLMWMELFPATQAALVVDEESNRDQFKAILTRYLQNLPRGYRRGVRQNNRNQLALDNGSILYYLIAGTKKKGTFGHGKGLNYMHATEVGRYADAEAWASFKSALAENNPNRLYLAESTARGHNLFEEVWEEAIESTETKAIFLGWWTKETYRVKRDSRLFDAMMKTPRTEAEIERIEAVKKQFGVEIDDEQLAWYRAKHRELLSGEQGFVEQEFPWTPEEAFRSTGKLFFPHRQLNVLFKHAQQGSFAGFRYHFGETFDTIQVDRTRTIRETELRIWQPPSRFGTYAIGADPAYGNSTPGNTWRDLFAIEVLRCYADRVVQVAEYAAPDVDPAKFAWVIAHLCGLYVKTKLVLELNGPGNAVLSELNHVRRELQQGHRAAYAREKGLTAALTHMSYFLYQRPDSFAPSSMLHMKQTSETKGTIMRRLKDAVMLNAIDIRSVPLVREMAKVVDDEGYIGAEGRNKDDRTIASALAYRGYDMWLRAPLSAAKQTYAEITKAELAAQGGKQASFQSFILQRYFSDKALERARPAPGGEWHFPIREKLVGM